MKGLPNLAARPFVNRRPLRRLALAAWILGGLLAVWDVALYWRYATGEGRRQVRAVELERQAAEEQARIDEAVDELAGLDLDWQSEQVRFVNLEADRQGFSWSRLFDQLGEVLPDGVRLSRLNPRAPRVDAQRLASEGIGQVATGRVPLAMSGAARSSEALYEFVDALFAHPAFQRPDLERESHRGEVEFSLSALYLPDAAPVAGEGAAEEGSAGTETDEPEAQEPPAAETTAALAAEEGR